MDSIKDIINCVDSCTVAKAKTDNQMGAAGSTEVIVDRGIERAPSKGTIIQSSYSAQNVSQRGGYGKCF